MIQIEWTETNGWAAAVRGMRNPLESWDKSDSDFYGGPTLGENDLGLMKRLIRGGSEERKFLRMIHVSCDITAPLYWWKEFDTYKVGTTANSCSTMHKIHAKPFSVADFSTEHLTLRMMDVLAVTIANLNACRNIYNETQDKKWWWQLIQLLPTSYNQKRTVDLNYEVLARMYQQRKNHKLDEWKLLCEWMLRLPYGRELIAGGEADVEVQ